MAQPAHPGTTDILAPVSARAGEIRAALTAALLGGCLIFMAGFIGIEAVHDAAHDGRHSLTFPCH